MNERMKGEQDRYISHRRRELVHALWGRLGHVGVGEFRDPACGGVHRLIESAEQFRLFREESGIVDGSLALAESCVIGELEFDIWIARP